MCTLILANQVFTEFPIVVAANRDELLDRPSEPPMVRAESGFLLVLSPRDLQRGGTWIGVNEHGVFCGLTNRYAVKSKPGKSSRGALVFEVLKFSSAREAANQYIDKLQGTEFNGFFAVVADAEEALFFHGDGNKIVLRPLPSGLFVITNHGVGFDTTGPKRVANVINAWEQANLKKQEPLPNNLSALLDLHDEWRYGTCINEPENNYGTKSSAIVRLTADKWEYWHRERTRESHICKQEFKQIENYLRLRPKIQ